MARTSTRRWKGCAMCKDHKHAGHGDPIRIPRSELRRMGGRLERVTRRTVTEPE